MLQSALSLFLGDAYVPALAPLVVLAFLGAGPRPPCLGPRRRRSPRHAPVQPWQSARPRGLPVVAAIYTAAAAGRGRVLAGTDPRAGRAEVLLRDRLPPRLRRRGRRRARHLDPRPSPCAPGSTRATIASFRGDGPLSPNPRRCSSWTTPAAATPPRPRRPRRGKRRTRVSTPLRRKFGPASPTRTTFVFDAAPGRPPGAPLRGRPRGRTRSVRDRTREQPLPRQVVLRAAGRGGVE